MHPSEVGRAPWAGSANVKVSPSAPVPWLIVSSKVTRKPSVATLFGQKAEPATIWLLGVRMRLAPLKMADPFSCQPPRGGAPGGAAAVPVPEKVMICRPAPSVPVSSQVPDAGPVAVGAKRTTPVTLPPAGMVVPSAIPVVAVNIPPVGGFDLVSASGAPPSLLTVKLSEREAPTATLPYGIEVVLSTMCGAVVAVPDIGHLDVAPGGAEVDHVGEDAGCRRREGDGGGDLGAGRNSGSGRGKAADGEGQ